MTVVKISQGPNTGRLLKANVPRHCLQFIAIIILSFLILMMFISFRWPKASGKMTPLLNQGNVEIMEKLTTITGSNTYGIDNCPCLRFGQNINTLWTLGAEQSTCSDFSTQRGNNQKVFSYTVYNPSTNSMKAESKIFKKYIGQLSGRAKYIQKHFPGWIMRIYNNVSSIPDPGKYLCDLYCTFDHVDICNVHDLPNFGDLTKKVPNGRMWRFAVMGDPLISIFMSRDTDSHILKREVVAINEFMSSNMSYHFMKDHPLHQYAMLGGLWGGWNNDTKLLADLRDQMYNEPPNSAYYVDQKLLKNIVYPVIKDRALQHVSYPCRMFRDVKTVPFSTERDDGYYTGWGPFKITERRKVLKTICPLECRPPDHQNWKFC